MGLKADIEEVHSAWARAPWWMRIWLLLSGFLAVSSIASLAEAVAKWKGFFKDAIDFYREWITQPITSLLRPLNLHFSPPAIDSIILAALVLASWTRASAIATNWSDRSARRWEIFWIIVRLVAFGTLLWRLNNQELVYSTWRLIIWLAVVIFVPLLLVPKTARIYLLQVFLTLFTVAVLAAINIGVQK